MGYLCNGELVRSLYVQDPSCKCLDPGQHFIGIKKHTAVQVFVFPYFHDLAAPALAVEAVQDIRFFFFVNAEFDADLLQAVPPVSKGYAPAFSLILLQVTQYLAVCFIWFTGDHLLYGVQAGIAEPAQLRMVEAQVPAARLGADKDFEGNAGVGAYCVAAAAFIFICTHAPVVDGGQDKMCIRDRFLTIKPVQI